MVQFSLAIVAAIIAPVASSVQITVESSGGNATTPHQYGFLHEDISNSGDGGLYAELIRNRAFQSSERFPADLSGWSPVNGASLSLKTLDQPLSSALKTSMNVAVGSSKGQVGFSNDGYWGMDVKKKKTYTGSFWVRGAYEGTFTASLRSNITGEVFGSTKLRSRAKASEWIEHSFKLVPTKSAPNSNNTFTLTFDAAGVKDGSLDFNLISLFPPTYKGRKNGLRVDLAEAIEGFHPTLLRIPGGNMLEGYTNKTWWNWKETIGPLKDRPGYPNVWGYQQTNGLGLMEYLELAEDMNLEIVLAVYAGLSLNGDITPQDKLQPFIDDALDQIEFVSGDATTKWGSVRAKLGHPAPFKLRYVEVGNEDWLAGGTAGWESYKEYRFPMFLKAINAKYPAIQVISSGSVFDGYNIPAPGNGDYHIYGTPDAMVDQFDLFDQTPITHIIGEAAAVHPNGGSGWDGGLMDYPFWIGTVGEAVSLLGYERNTDRIIGAAYAPIIRSLDRWQWAVTMIQFAADPALTTKSTSWYVWELFAGHLMTHTLPASSNFNPLYYVTGKNEDKGTYIFKGAVYNSTDAADVPVSLTFEGVKPGTKAELTILTGPANPYGYNDPFTGVNVVKTTREKITAGKRGSFDFSLPNLSVAVLETVPSKHPKRNTMRNGLRN
ncbi:putative alpha-n-arabinofuranosidase a protein [Achaetomium macrosporum]|uniref:non-reducing end alpha-L-arabinofuranosidase n=1 Tax=Achaetomium macrosporum TaxID=79813 RepID=A0AAN7C6V5_9PEZI|nr:putative alpha-n-arabinofuranosidase a protein [Achaetomium macrosporum]